MSSSDRKFNTEPQVVVCGMDTPHPSIELSKSELTRGCLYHVTQHVLSQLILWSKINESSSSPERFMP